MERSRSFRRAQFEKAKLRFCKLWLNHWRVTDRSTAPEFQDQPRATRPMVFVSPSQRWVAQMAETHGRPCSCFGCSKRDAKGEGRIPPAVRRALYALPDEYEETEARFVVHPRYGRFESVGLRGRWHAIRSPRR